MHRIKQFLYCWFSSFKMWWRWYSATARWLVFCWEALVLPLNQLIGMLVAETLQQFWFLTQSMLCARLPMQLDHRQQSSAAFCLGRPCGRMWGCCELQRFWICCAVAAGLENTPTNYRHSKALGAQENVLPKWILSKHCWGGRKMYEETIRV